MKSAVTIQLDPDLEKLLARFCRQTGRTRSDLVRDALRRQLSLLRFERRRRQALPFAEARGYLTEPQVLTSPVAVRRASESTQHLEPDPAKRLLAIVTTYESQR